MPNGDYQCSETAFGVVVHKKYVALLGATEARDFCVADGASVHLPIPRSQEENDWYKAASRLSGHCKKLELRQKSFTGGSPIVRGYCFDDHTLKGVLIDFNYVLDQF